MRRLQGTCAPWLPSPMHMALSRGHSVMTVTGLRSSHTTAAQGPRHCLNAGTWGSCLGRFPGNCRRGWLGLQWVNLRWGNSPSHWEPGLGTGEDLGCGFSKNVVSPTCPRDLPAHHWKSKRRCCDKVTVGVSHVTQEVVDMVPGRAVSLGQVYRPSSVCARVCM